jgi:hypothetical protein
MERLTQLGDAAAGAVGAVGSAIAIGQGRGQGAHSHVVLAATKGLLTLAGRVPLVGHLAAALQDLCIVYQVRPGAGNRGEASRADYLFTNSWPVGSLTQGPQALLVSPLGPIHLGCLRPAAMLQRQSWFREHPGVSRECALCALPAP